MTPLIDVVFLLLTFFIYSLIMMIRVEVLPVTFTAMATSGAPDPATAHPLTIDRKGDLYLDGKSVSLAELETRLSEMASDPAAPKIVVAMEETADAGVDRGPTFIHVIERIRAAGVGPVIVGQPRRDASTASPGGEELP